MQATIQARPAKSSSTVTERHVLTVRRHAPRDPRPAAAGAARPSRLQRFFDALVAALAVPSI
jgi:hypothetical protein